jgi:hypothetical protein
MSHDKVIQQFIEDTSSLYDEARELLTSKQIDYGPNNIQLSPFGPQVGLLVRLQDKVSRAANLIGQGHEPNHESLRDTFIDILNYGAIGVMLIDGTFPSPEQSKVNG